MPRSRSSSRGSGKRRFGLFGGGRSAAPARPAARPAPATTRTATPPAQHAPQSGGGILSGIGSTIAQGMAFGTGSAIAHRAVDAVAGPRQVEHVHSNQESNAPAAQAQQNAPPQSCDNFQLDLTKCLENNKNDIASCQSYFDMFRQCQEQQRQFV